MTIYLLPPASDPVDIIDLTKKAGVPFEQFSSLREMILKSEGVPIVLGTIRPQDLLVLNRYARTLVDELPSIVMSAPGVVYTGDWVSLASAMPALDWKEIQQKLQKSGHLAGTPEQLESRDLGSPTFVAPTGYSMLKGKAMRPLDESERHKLGRATLDEGDPYDPDADTDA